MSITRQFLNEFRPLFRMLEEPLSRSPAYLGYPSGSVFNDPFFNSPLLNRPAVDVTEEGNKYVLEADLPGVKKEDLEVRIGDAGRSVTIEGKLTDRRRQPQVVESSEGAAKTEDTGNQISTKRSFARDSSFMRTVWLSRPVDGNNVAAKLDDGVLTIAVNKMEDKASVVVPVQ